MKKASDVLRGLLGEENAALAGKWSAFFSGWQKLAGTDIAAHSRVVDVKQGVVIVEVDHPGWLQVLQMKKAKILSQMKKKYPALGIENMRIFVADAKREEHRQPAGNPAADPDPADGGTGREQVENSEEYQRFKAMLERLKKTRRS